MILGARPASFHDRSRAKSHDLFSSEAVSNIERVRKFLDIRNPGAAARAVGAIWAALERVEPEIAGGGVFSFDSGENNINDH